MGNVFIVNRLTGKQLYKSEPFVEQSANIFSAPSRAGTTLLPGVNGGSLWQPPAFSPRKSAAGLREPRFCRRSPTDLPWRRWAKRPFASPLAKRVRWPRSTSAAPLRP